MVVGVKLTLAPPQTDRMTELLKPPLMLVVIVEVPLNPWATLSKAGDAETVNEPAAKLLQVRRSTLRTVRMK